MTEMERLQKILSQAGLASRREAERWIQEGRVTVNGVVVKKLGSQAEPGRDKIKVDGKLISQSSPRYFLFHKPPGLLTTMQDPEGRPNLGAWLESLGKRGRLFPVGRLDFNSSGLLLLTNDGVLAQRLSHPRYGVTKVYRVKISGRPSESELESVRRGIRLEDGMTAPARVKVRKLSKNGAWLDVEIHEGRNREVRRMFRAIGYFVEKLERIRLGPIILGSLPPGQMRPLSREEITALKKIVGMGRPEKPHETRKADPRSAFLPPEKQVV